MQNNIHIVTSVFEEIEKAVENGEKMLAVLVDPEKFEVGSSSRFFESLAEETTHIFVGGSTDPEGKTAAAVQAIKLRSSLPVILFPGDHAQITEAADALLFLSLISGQNPEYLVGQQIKAVTRLRNSSLEIIPTGYILVDGGRESAVQRVSSTLPLPQTSVEMIVDIALAGKFSGKKLIYLEAGSGAAFPVSEEIIKRVKEAIRIPLIVGGGIRNRAQLEKAYRAGADMVVIGTLFESGGMI